MRTDLHLMWWIEGVLVTGLPLFFFLCAFLVFKAEHVEHHPTRVLIGAVFQGLTIGGLLAFVILPLRIAFFVPDPTLMPDAPPPKGIASLAILPALLLLLVIRRGVLARAPLIGTYIRAYRRAALKHPIDAMRHTLTRLEALDAHPAKDL
jgi:hypothetical protein